MNNNHYISFKKWACGINDPEIIEGARLYASAWIDRQAAGAKSAAKKRIKSDDPKAVKAREKMRAWRDKKNPARLGQETTD